MSLSGYTVDRVTRREITDFLEKWHYSKSINGCIADFCYSLYSPSGEMVGAMFFGRMAMANQWEKFANSEKQVIELRRLACVDDTPKNAESFFIGKALRMLRSDWRGSVVVSYSDKEYGHTGTIYRASNFLIGDEIPGAKVIVSGDRQYHDKAIRTKYKGELKPFAARLVEDLKHGRAYYKKTKGKNTFIYLLRRKQLDMG